MKKLSRIVMLLVTIAIVTFGLQSPSNATTAGDTTTLKVVEKASVHSNVHIHGTLVEWLHIKFSAKQKKRLTKPSNCITTDGWNYYGTTAGQGRHWDHNMRLCRSSKSFTGWVKVGGGDSGSHCMNPATPANKPPAPHVPVIKGPITETRSFAHFFEFLKVSQGIKLHIDTTCGSAHIVTDIWTKGVVKAKSLVAVFLKSSGTMRSFNSKLKAALVMSAKSSSKVVVIITCQAPPPPPPPAPTFSCNTLHITKGDNRTVTIDTFNTSQTGGATFKNAVIDWGDGTSDTFAAPVGKSHTYGGTGNGPFGIAATAHFDVNGVDKSDTSSGCMQSISFPPPVAQPCTVDTVENPNDVLWGNSRTIKVTGTCPTGVQGTLKSSANIGSVATADQSVAVSGDFTVFVHYTAPTEGTSDTFTSKVFSAGHLDDQKSVSFALTNPNPDPMVRAPGGHSVG